MLLWNGRLDHGILLMLKLLLLDLLLLLLLLLLLVLLLLLLLLLLVVVLLLELLLVREHGSLHGVHSPNPGEHAAVDLHVYVNGPSSSVVGEAGKGLWRRAETGEALKRDAVVARVAALAVVCFFEASLLLFLKLGVTHLMCLVGFGYVCEWRGSRGIVISLTTHLSHLQIHDELLEASPLRVDLANNGAKHPKPQPPFP
jgi:hypothetical protein